MKKLLLIALLVFSLPTQAETVARGFSLAWDMTGTAHDGFRLIVNGAQTWQGPEQVVAASDAGIVDPGEYTVSVLAYNAEGESAPSDALTFQVVVSEPEAPSGLRISIP